MAVLYMTPVILLSLPLKKRAGVPGSDNGVISTGLSLDSFANTDTLLAAEHLLQPHLSRAQSWFL